MALPANTDVEQLLVALQTDFIALDEFASDRVEIGEIDHIESRDDDLFPCISIVYTGTDGQEYISQRQYHVDISFQIDVHLWNESEDRVSGNDMITLSQYTYLIKNTVFAFLNRGTPPCDNFLLVNSEYRMEAWYQLFTEHINTGQLDVSFHIEGNDTDA